MSTIFNYFTSCNSAKGYLSNLESNLVNLKNIYILKGTMYDDSILKLLYNDFLKNNYDMEVIYSTFDSKLIQSIIIPKLSTAIVDGSYPDKYDGRAPGALDQFIDCTSILDKKVLQKQTKEILKLQSEITLNYEKSYICFANSLKIHDELEAIYINNMSFDKSDSLRDKIISKLFDDAPIKENESILKDRFLGGATAEGSVDFIENLTSNLSKRYFLKGRPGSGKSTFLRGIIKAATSKNIDVDIYHCGFDPDSLDMLIFPDLRQCIFDSTAPHEHFPVTARDEIIDMYTETILEGTDEDNAHSIKELKEAIAFSTSEGTKYLKHAKTLQTILRNIYKPCIDESELNKIFTYIGEQINTNL